MSKRIISNEPIQITILYNEAAGQARCDITRAGRMYNGLSALELVLILNNVQNSYIVSGLGARAGAPSGLITGENHKEEGSNGGLA